MARFYFHVSTPDEYFHDNVGYDVNDLAAAHSVAVRLAGRLETFVSFFLDRVLDFRRWTVEVTDETHQRVFTVMFPKKQRKKAQPETIPEPERITTGEPGRIKALFDKLLNSPLEQYSVARGALNAPRDHGVYVIYSSGGKVRYVGRTQRRGLIRGGLQQRLTTHRIKYGRKLCFYRYLVVKSARQRALLEAYATGCLCPLDLGLGDKRISREVTRAAG
jgi:hypothetical protein